MVPRGATEASRGKLLQRRAMKIDHQNLGAFQCQRQRQFRLERASALRDTVP